MKKNEEKTVSTEYFVLLCGGSHEHIQWVILIAVNFNMQFRIQ